MKWLWDSAGGSAGRVKLGRSPRCGYQARGGPRPWSGLPRRATVLGFPFSLSQGLMEVLVAFLFSFFEWTEGEETRGEERRAFLCLGFPFCAFRASPGLTQGI